MSKRPDHKAKRTARAAFLDRVAASPWMSLALIAIVALVANSTSFNAGFHFDDESSIVYNPVIKDLSRPLEIWKATPTRFVTYLSFAVDYRIGGLNVTGYHVVNLGLHIACGFVVWLLVRRILVVLKKSDSERRLTVIAPLLAAAAFISHPIQTQAVTYIAQRATVLATLFYLLSVYFFLGARMIHVNREEGRQPWTLYALAALAGFFGLFSKEIILTLPFAFVLVDACFVRGEKGVNWKFFALVMGVFVLFSVGLLATNLVSLEDAPAIPQIKYLSTQPQVLLTYIRLLFLPYGQNLDYMFPIAQSPLETWTLVSLAVILLLLAFGVRLFRRERLIAFGIFWYVLVLLPESSILPLADVIFEHRLYLPMLGFSVVLVAGAMKLQRWFSVNTILAGAAFLVCVWTYLSHERNKVWKDEISLWSDVILKAPDNPRAINNRGRALGDLGRFDEALADFNKALAMNPNNADAYNNRANIFVQRGQLDEAISDCNKALALAPRMDYAVARIYFNRGTALVRKNDLDAAIRDFDEAIRYEPNHESAHFNRGIAYAAKGLYEKAITDYTFVLSVNPTNARALNNRGIAYRESGVLDSAAADFTSALQIQPAYGQALINRGLLWSLKGELLRAEEDLTKGLGYLPRSADGLAARGEVRLRRADLRNARSDFEQALALAPGQARALAGIEQVKKLLGPGRNR